MKNNIKILTSEERKLFNEKYMFSVTDEYVFVKCKNFSRFTIHSINEPFKIGINGRKLTISTQAIDIFKTNKDYSLIDIQCVINSLIVMYQQPTTISVVEMLKNLN